MTNYEIERKFLIEYPDTDKLCFGKAEIVQTYLDDDTRVRKMVTDGQERFFKTEKKKISDIKRIENEREISKAEYLDFMRYSGKYTVRKTRYFLPFKNHCIEIDVYPFWSDKAVAEVELKDEREETVFPDFIKIIKEVTDDESFKNAALAKKYHDEN